MLDKVSTRYERLFSRLKSENKKAFIPYTMLGYPERESSLRAIKMMLECGAHALELGLAFSDPLADGPVIQNAAAQTLASGFKTRDALSMVAEIRKLDAEIPITLMCYFNCVLAHGLDNFCKSAQEAGVDGLLIVDLPPQESTELSQYCRKYSLSQIFIISPLTTSQRLQNIAEHASGFLYAVSRLGITGVEERYDDNLATLLREAARLIGLPLAVGFGVSTPEQAMKMFEIGADAVITGSRIIEFQSEQASQFDEKAFADYLRSMVEIAARPPAFKA